MFKRTYPFTRKTPPGFTFIELLLVIVIIGIIIAVILPRAWRANVEAKYGLVRQAATELASWGMTWAQRNLDSQAETDTCNLDDYVETLEGYTGDGASGPANNWVTITPTPSCHTSGVLNFTVADIMPQEKQPRNPFNGLSYLSTGNNGSPFQAGDLFLVRFDNRGTGGDGYFHYYFIYHGTDSTDSTDWHAGMAETPLASVRNGVFMARLQP